MTDTELNALATRRNALREAERAASRRMTAAAAAQQYTAYAEARDERNALQQEESNVRCQMGAWRNIAAPDED